MESVASVVVGLIILLIVSGSIFGTVKNCGCENCGSCAPCDKALKR